MNDRISVEESGRGMLIFGEDETIQKRFVYTNATFLQCLFHYPAFLLSSNLLEGGERCSGEW